MTDDRLLRIDEVMERVGGSRSSIYRWEKVGRFPARRRIGSQAVGWLASEIEEWIASRPVGGPGGGTGAVPKHDSSGEEGV